MDENENSYKRWDDLISQKTFKANKLDKKSCTYVHLILSNKTDKICHVRRRQAYALLTATARLQSSTEEECSSLFLDISSLSTTHISYLRNIGLLNVRNEISLLRSRHKFYLTRPFPTRGPLPASYITLDSSKTWILYWCIHSLDLLQYKFDESLALHIIKTIEKYWMDITVYILVNNNCIQQKKIKMKAGGFGGGPRQIPHCATTYAAILTVCILASYGHDNSLKSVSNSALDLLKRKRLSIYYWFISLRYPFKIGDSKCGYRMHHDGEVDVRATYTVLSISSLLNICTSYITYGVLSYIVSCQTYEGGFGGEEYNEAHGGYTFCAIASIKILISSCKIVSETSYVTWMETIDFGGLKRWLVRRQMSYEGGFSGRTNKLVDGCYSFWVGASIVILELIQRDWKNFNKKYKERYFVNGGKEKIGNVLDYGIYYHNDNANRDTNNNKVENDLIEISDDFSHSKKRLKNDIPFNNHMLQQYILFCAQNPNGGMRDKPSKDRDFYHTCYVLSGLSVSQHCLSSQLVVSPPLGTDNTFTPLMTERENHFEKNLNTEQDEGNNNIISKTHPVFNIRVERVIFILEKVSRW